MAEKSARNVKAIGEYIISQQTAINMRINQGRQNKIQDKIRKNLANM